MAECPRSPPDGAEGEHAGRNLSNSTGAVLLRGHAYLVISDDQSHASNPGSNRSGYRNRDVENQLRSARDVLVEARTGRLRVVRPGVELLDPVAASPLDFDLLVRGLLGTLRLVSRVQVQRHREKLCLPSAGVRISANPHGGPHLCNICHAISSDINNLTKILQRPGA